MKLEEMQQWVDFAKEHSASLEFTSLEFIEKLLAVAKAAKFMIEGDIYASPRLAKLCQALADLERD